MLMNRQEFKKRFESLSSAEIAKAANQINGIVIEEVKDIRYKRKAWEVAGFSPLDTSGVEYLRPVAQVRCSLDSSQPKGLGYSIWFVCQWFVD